jgi:hypothetical protein
MAKMEKHDDEAQDKKLFKKLIKKEESKLGVKKMAKGGVTGKAMRAVGRNLARAHNQKSGSK